MNCEEAHNKFYDYLFDLLDDDEKRELESHLEPCESCQQVLEKSKKEQSLLKTWKTPPPPEGLVEETAARAAAADDHADRIVPLEPDLPWLGSPGFWKIAAACAIFVFGLAFKTYEVANRTADPQQAFLYGPSNLAPGVPAAYRVFVRNGQTAEAIPQAEVRFRLVSNQGETLWQGRSESDENGMVHLAPDIPADAEEGQYRLVVMTSSEEGSSEIARNVSLKRSFKVMVSTDKPLYQPGQTIHMRALAMSTANMKPVAGQMAVFEVKDAKGNKVFKKTQQTSEFGIISADFRLADQVNMGAYTVSVNMGDTYSERSVKVERYRLPKFKVELTTDKGFYLPGQVLKGTVSAQYTFGEPVSSGKVKLLAQEFIEAFRDFAEVEGRTDANGKFTFEIPLKDVFVGQARKKGDAFVSLYATVVDPAGHEQAKVVQRTVTAQPIRVELFPESGELVQGVENVVYIVTAYPDGRPAKTKIRFRAGDADFRAGNRQNQNHAQHHESQAHSYR